MKVKRWAVALGILAGAGLALGAPSPARAKLRLKASHQFAEGDVRDQLVRVFAERVSERLGGDVAVRVYPAKSLYKPKAQWDAMRQGALDMSVFPLDYASGKVPQLSVTLMPCAVSSMAQAMSWRDKPIGKRLDALLEANGVKVLVWAWLDGGIGSTARQIRVPEDVKGLKMRAAGKKFEYMLGQAGASITSMPSSELYHALSTGVLNACLTSSASFVSYRLYEQLKYMNAPRDYAIWYMAEPLVISMKTWSRLTPEQQKVFEEVGRELERDWVLPHFSKAKETLAETFSQAGVEVHHMTREEFQRWLAFAKETAWKDFAETVPDGKELLDLALEAME
ncbi:MAG: TRAP transporter substrate-binding protein DctP [Deferrisomatales bacterium]